MTAWRFGIIGPIGVGKDTVCAAVVARAGRRARQVRIGDFVISDLDRAVTEDQMTGRMGTWLARLRVSLDAAGVTSVRELPDVRARRECLQLWGAHRRRERPTYWLERLATALDEADDDEVIYVSDVRTPAEVDHLRRRGFLIAQLVAPREVLELRAATRDGVRTTPRARANDEYTSIAGESPHADLVLSNVGDPDACARAIVDALVSHNLDRTTGSPADADPLRLVGQASRPRSSSHHE
jgi:hypothetical protein